MNHGRKAPARGFKAFLNMAPQAAVANTCQVAGAAHAVGEFDAGGVVLLQNGVTAEHRPPDQGLAVQRSIGIDKAQHLSALSQQRIGNDDGVPTGSDDDHRRLAHGSIGSSTS